MWARHAFVVAAYYNYCVEFVVLENNADSVRTVVVVAQEAAAGGTSVQGSAVVAPWSPWTLAGRLNLEAAYFQGREDLRWGRLGPEDHRPVGCCLPA